jgi:UPF0716 protein FxsA
MNSLLIIIIGIPALEIFTMIKVGQHIGALNTVLLIITTAVIGIYYARIEGLNTIRSGLTNLYKNQSPAYELISGASIAFAAILLIIPGFVTDFMGLILLLPFTRKILIKNWIKKKYAVEKKNKDNVVDGEIIERDKDEL